MPRNPKNPQATRETVESIVVAVVLAFLFRAFIAEAFVIPTGSMAPTLQGRHMDVRCKQCGYQYRTGASGENPDSLTQQEVTDTTCPMCRYTMKLQKDREPNHNSFNGDRILVSKFAYLLNEPERWDVIVFKYPGNAKQNYIKRLIGLPGEEHYDPSRRRLDAQGDGRRRLDRTVRQPSPASRRTRSRPCCNWSTTRTMWAENSNPWAGRCVGSRLPSLRKSGLAVAEDREAWVYEGGPRMPGFAIGISFPGPTTGPTSARAASRSG